MHNYVSCCVLLVPCLLLCVLLLPGLWLRALLTLELMPPVLLLPVSTQQSEELR